MTQLLIPSRKPISGPEATLLMEARRSGLPGERMKNAVVFEEPRLTTGFPDLLIALPKKGNRLQAASNGKLAADHFKILAHIYSTENYLAAQISRDLSISPRSLQRILSELALNKMIRLEGNDPIRIPLDQVFGLSKIIAIEAKIKDWRKAIEQAMANTWFCSESYILVPQFRNMEHICESASRAGVGVLMFDGVNAVEMTAPVSLEIPNSYGSWIVNDWTFRHFRD